MTHLKSIEESKLLSEENIAIKGTKAIKLTYDNSNNTLKLSLYLRRYNKENYLVFFLSKIDYFDIYIPEFEQIRKTMKWVE